MVVIAGVIFAEGGRLQFCWFFVAGLCFVAAVVFQHNSSILKFDVSKLFNLHKT